MTSTSSSRYGLISVLRVPARIATPGVLRYPLADGSEVRKARFDADLFDDATIASLVGVPVRRGHADTESRGIVETARRDGRFIVADLLIHDTPTIRSIKAGELVEVSPCSLAKHFKDERGGTLDGERYDSRARDIRFEHVALAPRGGGRGGPEIRILTEALT